MTNVERYDLPIRVIRNSTNRGFAHAANQGAKDTQADYLLFLNPDTKLYQTSLSKPVRFMEQHAASNIGIVGVQLTDDYGHVARTCARFPRPRHFLAKMLGLDYLFPRCCPSHFMAEWDHRKNREVDHVAGAFFLVKCSVFESLNWFDERFFVYLEDLDFSYRACQAGWKSYYLAEAQAYHKGGGISSQVKSTRLFYSLRSRIMYGYKHFGWGAASALTLGTLLLEPVARLVRATARCAVKEAVETIKGYLKLWSSTPLILREAWRRK